MAYNKSEYDAEYNRNNTKTYCLRLSLKNDADIIEKLDSVNKQAYIKNLIREDLKEGAE